MATTVKYKYDGKGCIVHDPVYGKIEVNQSTTQTKLKYLYNRGVILEGKIEEV
jgi:hypothetical protein